MKLLICYGTRPEYIKVKPLIDKFKGKVNFGTLHVGQHTDKSMINSSEPPDHHIRVSNVSNNRLNNIFSQIMMHCHDIFQDYTHVLVQGDTATVAALAIGAYNCDKKVIHLEAGLRTYDLKNPHPEEAYRQMVSRIADLHLCPTLPAKKNLNEEKIWDNIAVVGNTVLDNLKDIKTSYSNKVLVTLHRRENLPIMADWFDLINKEAMAHPELTFFIPTHPAPHVQTSRERKLTANNIIATDAIPHKYLIDILKDCKFVITDSGGIQEEASFLKKKVIVCRKTTERGEGLGSFFKLCEYPSQLPSLFNEFNNDYEINDECPFGQGDSAEKILNEFKKRYSDMCIQ